MTHEQPPGARELVEKVAEALRNQVGSKAPAHGTWQTMAEAALSAIRQDHVIELKTPLNGRCRCCGKAVGDATA